MKKVAMVAAGVFLLTSFGSLFASKKFDMMTLGEESSSFHEVIGDFAIIAGAKHNSIVLANNQIYEPTNHRYAKISRNWELQDTVRVIQIKDNRFILINLDKGQTIKSKLLD